MSIRLLRASFAVALAASATLATLATRVASAQDAPPPPGNSVKLLTEVMTPWGTSTCGADTALTSYSMNCTIDRNGLVKTTASGYSNGLGRVGAATTLAAAGVTPNGGYGDYVNARVEATGSYTGQISIGGPADVIAKVKHVEFGMRLHGSMSAMATSRVYKDGQCFYTTGYVYAGAALTFASYGSESVVYPGGNTVGISPTDKQVGCGTEKNTDGYSEYLRFLMPVGDGGNGFFSYELTSYSTFNATAYAAFLGDAGFSADIASDFIHTAGIETIRTIDEHGDAVTDATYAFSDPNLLVAPLYPTTAAPEPATLALFATGGLWLVGVARRRQKQRA